MLVDNSKTTITGKARKGGARAIPQSSCVLCLWPDDWSEGQTITIKASLLTLRARLVYQGREERYHAKGKRKGQVYKRGGEPVLFRMEHWRIPLKGNDYLCILASLQELGISPHDVYYGNDGQFGVVGLHGSGSGEAKRYSAYRNSLYRQLERDGKIKEVDFLIYVYGGIFLPELSAILPTSLDAYSRDTYGMELPDDWRESADWWLAGLREYNRLPSLHERYIGEQLTLDPCNGFWLVAWAKLQEWIERQQKETKPTSRQRAEFTPANPPVAFDAVPAVPRKEHKPYARKVSAQLEYHSYQNWLANRAGLNPSR